MIKLFNEDNLEFSLYDRTMIIGVDVIYGDCIYESEDFSWVDKYWRHLVSPGLFIIQTDFHTQHRYRTYMEDVIGANFVSHLVWKCEWGNMSKRKFHQCYDDILIYSNSLDWKFDTSKVQVPKATARSKGLNPSGRDTKTATAWIDDITLTTVSKERIKTADGKLIKWQKPKELLRRLVSPFVGENCIILDPFMGSGTLGEVCVEEDWHYVGIENDTEVFNLAKKRIQEAIDTNGEKDC